MAERHAIYAYLSTGVKVRVSPFMGWANATRVFYECELSAGCRVAEKQLVVGDYAGTVRWFAVRSADDPGWPHAQPSHDVRTALGRDLDDLGAFLAGEAPYRIAAVPC